MKNIFNYIKNIVKAIPVLNTYLSSDLKTKISLFKNKEFNGDKTINYLLNNNYFYFTLTIISLLFSYYISLNMGSFFVSLFISLWIIYKNNKANLLRIIIIISILVLLYYYTGTVYCEGGDTDVNTIFGDNSNSPSGDNTNSLSGDNTNTSSGDSTKSVILESKDHYHITKEDFNKGVELINQSIITGIEAMAPNLGAGTAAAGAIAAVLKNSNLPTLPKLALTGATAAVAAGGTRIGLVGADALLRINTSKESSEIVSDTGNETQSPVNDFIHSVLENGDMLSPLEELLRCQLGLNVLMLVEIFILIMILYNKLFINSGFNIINKYLKFGDKFETFSNKMNSFNDKFFYIIFIINCSCLIFAILCSFIIIGDLNTNLEIYVDNYNNIKK